MEQEPANPLATTGTSDRSTKEGSKGDTIRSGPSSPLELAPKSRPQIPPTPLHMAQTIEGWSNQDRLPTPAANLRSQLL